MGQAPRRRQGARSIRPCRSWLLRRLRVWFLSYACLGLCGIPCMRCQRIVRSRRPGCLMVRVRVVVCLPTCLVFRPLLLLDPFLPRFVVGGACSRGLPRTGVRCIPSRQLLSRTQVVAFVVLASQSESRGDRGNTPRVLRGRACHLSKVHPVGRAPLTLLPTVRAPLGLLCWSVWGKKASSIGTTNVVVKTRTSRLSWLTLICVRRPLRVLPRGFPQLPFA